MYTQCPDCSAVYEITTEELGAAAGLVRCGSCDATFSALRRLSATPPAPPRELEAPPDQAELNFASADSDDAAGFHELGMEVTANGEQDNGFEALADNDAVEAADAEPMPASNRAANETDKTTGDVTDDPDLAVVAGEVDGNGGHDSDESTALADAATTRIAAAELYEEREDLVDEFIDDIDELAELPPDDDAQEDPGSGSDDTRVMHQEPHSPVDDGNTVDAAVDEHIRNEAGDLPDSSDQDATAETQRISGELDGRIESNAGEATQQAGGAVEAPAPAGDAGDEKKPDEGASEDTTSLETAENETIESTDSIASIDVIEDWDTDEGEHDIEALLADDALMEEDLVDALTDVADQQLAADDAGREAGVSDTATDTAGAGDTADHSDDTGDAEVVDESEKADKDEGSSDSEDTDDIAEADEAVHAASADASDEVRGDEDLAGAELADAVDDSGHILTTGVDGTFQPDLDDEHDYRDLQHYLKPGKSFIRKLGDACLLALLLALLGVQIVHHNRALLATHPEYGRYVQAAYRSLGLHLDVAWDVADYRIARHTVVPEKDNPMKLMARATIVNNSAYRRPLPLVRLELRNRWGDAIFARVFNASDYLRDSAASELAGGGRVEVALDLRNPTDDAEIGYSFDVCLAGPGGVPNCGNVPIFVKK